MDVITYDKELNRSHWDLLLEADPRLEAVQKYVPPQNPDAEVFIIGRPHDPYALCVTVPIKDGLRSRTLPPERLCAVREWRLH